MTFSEREKELIYACSEVPPDFMKARALIEEGLNINAYDDEDEEDFESLLGSVVTSIPSNAWKCDICELECERKQCKLFDFEHLTEIIQFFINNGWNSRKYGLNVLHKLLYSTYSKEIFDAACLICEKGIQGTQEEFDDVLETVGMKESYTFCCENDYPLENVFDAYYEAVLREKEGKAFSDIDTYHAAIGMKVDCIVLFGTEEDLFLDEQARHCFGKDIGFVCGGKTLILREGINILCMNRRREEERFIECDGMFDVPVVGKTIRGIDFSHNEVRIDRTRYSQPTIHMHFDDGTVIRFTHNFGELPDKKSVSRFEVDVLPQNH